jgi:hypothetical protein
VPEIPGRRLAVVAGAAYIERIRRLPSRFTVTLKAEPVNRFNRSAVAVLAGGEKVGYLPPEFSCHYFEAAGGPAPLECPARHAPVSAFEDTGVAIIVDLASCPPL